MSINLNFLINFLKILKLENYPHPKFLKFRIQTWKIKKKLNSIDSIQFIIKYCLYLKCQNHTILNTRLWLVVESKITIQTVYLALEINFFI